jgi:hypothetical protein
VRARPTTSSSEDPVRTTPQGHSMTRSSVLMASPFLGRSRYVVAVGERLARD